MNNFDEELANFKDIVFNQPIIKEYFKIKMEIAENDYLKDLQDKIVFYAQELTKNVNNDDVYLASKEKYETYLKEYNSNPLVINLHEISKEVENTLLELKNILEN